MGYPDLLTALGAFPLRVVVRDNATPENNFSSSKIVHQFLAVVRHAALDTRNRFSTARRAHHGLAHLLNSLRGSVFHLAGSQVLIARAIAEKSPPDGITNKHRPPLRAAHTAPRERFSSESVLS